ncbi:MAG: RNA polymerase sigma factor, partial [Verrucomicrobia bacterium]|nr:RNA polymerase sigma factor [Verrucomicrobiota bacterium]
MHEESKNDDATNDEVLVIQSRSGDVSAFDELLERYQERLWRHALRLTNNEAAAWDILQETLLAIARGIGGLENETAFSAWAYRIVSHKSNDWLRRNIRRRDRESVFIS